MDSNSNQNSSVDCGDTGDSDSDDVMDQVLEMLNFKIVPKEPGDTGFYEYDHIPSEDRIYSAEFCRLAGIIERLKVEKDELQRKELEMRGVLAKEREQVVEKDRENEKIKKEASDRFKKEIELLQMQLSEKETELNDTNSKVGDYEAECSVLRKQLESREGIISAKSQEIVNAQKDISAREEEMRKQEITISSLRKELEGAQENNTRRQSEMGDVKAQVLKLTLSLLASEQNYIKLQTQFEQKNEQIQRINAQFEKSKELATAPKTQLMEVKEKLGDYDHYDEIVKANQKLEKWVKDLEAMVYNKEEIIAKLKKSVGKEEKLKDKLGEVPNESQECTPVSQHSYRDALQTSELSESLPVATSTSTIMSSSSQKSSAALLRLAFPTLILQSPSSPENMEPHTFQSSSEDFPLLEQITVESETPLPVANEDVSETAVDNSAVEDVKPISIYDQDNPTPSTSTQRITVIHAKDQSRARKHSNFCKCGMTFPNKGGLQNHVNYFRSKDHFKCPQCPKRFKSTVIVRKHAWKDHQINYELKWCRKCGSTFQNWNKLRSHQFTRHPRGEVITVDLTDCPTPATTSKHSHDASYFPTNRKFQCRLCSRRFVYLCRLNAHMRKCHKDVNNEKVEMSSCGECGRTFSSKLELFHHRKVEHSRTTALSSTQITYKTLEVPTGNKSPAIRNTKASRITQVHKKRKQGVQNRWKVTTCNSSLKMRISVAQTKQGTAMVQRNDSSKLSIEDIAKAICISEPMTARRLTAREKSDCQVPSTFKAPSNPGQSSSLDCEGLTTNASSSIQCNTTPQDTDMNPVNC